MLRLTTALNRTRNRAAAVVGGSCTTQGGRSFTAQRGDDQSLQQLLPAISKYDPQCIKLDYGKLARTLRRYQTTQNCGPLTMSEKILMAHLDFDATLGRRRVPGKLKRGESYLYLRPDRVAMQDVTAQMAMLQFMTSGSKSVAVPTTIHCDHLIQARSNAVRDLEDAISENREVYDFLSTASKKYGVGFWKPGSGIIHQVFLENYAFPGLLMIGTDSHTPNGGGLNALCIGVGGADAVDVMANFPWEIKYPRIIGINLRGQLNAWCTPKDIILKVAELLTVSGGTGSIIEYYGDGVKHLSATGMATICNMGAEVGATTSIFPFTKMSSDYLKATGREDVAEYAYSNRGLFKPDHGAQYDLQFEIKLDELEPLVNGPFTPDLSHTISRLGRDAKEEGYPLKIHAALVGSCTNSSYQDLSRCVSIMKQALNNSLKATVPFYLSPGSEKVRSTCEKSGFLEIFREFGATLLANACGPCIGQWKRFDIETNEKNTIINSYNRNFAGRNDANPKTFAFVASPEIVTALAIKGTLDFNPLKDALCTDSENKDVYLKPPTGEMLPERFDDGIDTFQTFKQEGEDIDIKIDPTSSRLQALKPFVPINSQQLQKMIILIKVRGKCTTDHISAAGPWLRFRGHLENISNNLLIGAVNEDSNKPNCITNHLTGDNDCQIPQTARYYQSKQRMWCVIGEENYGEGSSRELAALEPRYLGGGAVIVKSFARIHETNLKKQGMLALTFSNPDDYNLIQSRDEISILDVDSIEPNKPVICEILKKGTKGGKDDETRSIRIELLHTMNEAQIKWFKAGSALNILTRNANC
ncbi:MAG: aconitate hydratase [Marteilia pararefringens]